MKRTITLLVFVLNLGILPGQSYSWAVEERYFVNKDTMPAYVYLDGLFSDPKEIYAGKVIWYSKNVTHLYTFEPLFKKYTRLKPKHFKP